MSPLTALPPELLNHVAFYLHPTNLLSLRLTCSQCYNSTFDNFADRVLTQRWLLREESLATLLNITKHDKLRPRVTHFQLSTDMLADFTLDMFQRYADSDVTLGHYRAFLKCMRQQDDFLANGRRKAHQALVAVFAQMSALRHVKVGQWLQCGDEQCRRAWGAAPIETEIDRVMESYSLGSLDSVVVEDEDVPQTIDPEQMRSTPLCFQLVLHALVEAGRSVQSLSVGHWCGPHEAIDGCAELHGLEVAGLDTLSPANNVLCQQLQSVFQHLRFLRLALDHAYHHYPGPDPNEEPKDWLATFVGLATSLETLTLVFGGLSSYIRPAYDAEPFARLSRRPQCRYLRHLEFCNLEARSADLLTFLGKHASTVRVVTLRRIHLLDDNNSDETRHVRKWLTLLASLEKAPLLTSIELSCLYEADRSVLVFSTGHSLQCERCEAWTDHVGAVTRDGLSIECEHATYRSRSGRLPERLRWRSFRHPS